MAWKATKSSSSQQLLWVTVMWGEMRWNKKFFSLTYKIFKRICFAALSTTSWSSLQLISSKKQTPNNVCTKGQRKDTHFKCNSLRLCSEDVWVRFQVNNPAEACASNEEIKKIFISNSLDSGPFTDAVTRSFFKYSMKMGCQLAQINPLQRNFEQVSVLLAKKKKLPSGPSPPLQCLTATNRRHPSQIIKFMNPQFIELLPLHVAFTENNSCFQIYCFFFLSLKILRRKNEVRYPTDKLYTPSLLKVI